MGLVMSRVECSRCWLYQVWIQLAMSCLAWVLVTYRRLLIRSCWRVEKNDSAAALSKAEPTLPMDWTIPSRAQALVKRFGVVLRASVGVENHSLDGSASGGDGHVHRGFGQLGGGIGVAKSKPQHPPGEQVLDRPQVHGTLLGVDLFEIAAPLLIRPRSCEITADQIRRHRSGFVGAGQPSPAPFLPWLPGLGCA